MTTQTERAKRGHVLTQLQIRSLASLIAAEILAEPFTLHRAENATTELTEGDRKRVVSAVRSLADSLNRRSNKQSRQAMQAQSKAEASE